MRTRAVDALIACAIGFGCAFAASPGGFVGHRPLLPAAVLAGDPAYQEGFAQARDPLEEWDPSGILIDVPAHVVAAAELRAGRLPLWNPYAGCGQPLLESGDAAPLSPFLLPFDVAPSETTYGWFLLLQVAVAAGGAFAFARAVGEGGLAAATCAIVYALGGPAMARFDLPAEGAGFAMLPLCALAARSAAKGGLAGIGALGLATGVTIYAAHPTIAALAACGGGLAAACETPRAGLRIAGGIALGVGVGALAVLPFVHYLATGASSYKLEGTTSSLSGVLTYFQAVPESLRFGGGALGLAGIALATKHWTRRYAALSVLLLALLLVAAWIGPGRVRTLVPPNYALVVVAFAIALLAGQGLDALPSASLARALGAALLALVLTDAATHFELHRQPDVLAGDLVALAAVAGARLLASRTPRAAVLATLATAVLLALSAERLVDATSAGVPATNTLRALRDEAAPPARVAGLWYALLPNTGAIAGLADARATGALAPRRYRAYVSQIDGAILQPTFTLLTREGPLVDRMGVSRIASRPAQVPPGWRVDFADEHAAVGANPHASPRVFSPEHVELARDLDEARVRLRDLPSGTSVVEAKELPPLEAATASIRSYANERVAIETHAAAPALVVLTDTFADGWRATIDGAPARIVPTDVLFRGVIVPAGDHVVVMTYRPPIVNAALVLALACAALALLAQALRWMGGERGS